MGVALLLYAGFAITFAHFQIRGDASVYFNLMRRFFGEKPDFAFAYQFGSDVWNAPFFLVAKGLGAIFTPEPKTFHVSLEELSITAASQAAFLLTLYLGWRLLRELDLPAGPAVLFLSVFGSPLFFYVVFDPAMKHGVDTLVITGAVLLVLRLHRDGTDRQAIALGALAGLSLNIRYVNVAFFLAIACSLALRRRRALTLGGVTAAIVGPALFALPYLRGISYFVPSYFPKSAVGRYALGRRPLVADTTNPFNGFDPLIPFKMLFSDHRGMFVWTPLTAFGVIGFILLLRRAKRDDRGPFLWTLLAASAALVAAHSFWAEWDGAFSFSTRFLTALFPLVLVGVAELRHRFGWAVYPILSICVAWSLLLAFIHIIGYDGITAGDSATRMVRVYADTRSNMEHKLKVRITQRWSYLWYLPQGVDPRHVHGP
jgi:hypothetical protein